MQLKIIIFLLAAVLSASYAAETDSDKVAGFMTLTQQAIKNAINEAKARVIFMFEETERPEVLTVIKNIQAFLEDEGVALENNVAEVYSTYKLALQELISNLTVPMEGRKEEIKKLSSEVTARITEIFLKFLNKVVARVSYVVRSGRIPAVRSRIGFNFADPKTFLNVIGLSDAVGRAIGMVSNEISKFAQLLSNDIPSGFYEVILNDGYSFVKMVFKNGAKLIRKINNLVVQQQLQQQQDF